MTESREVTAGSRARRAIVYLRQSSERQVRHNQESQRLQYALVGRARDLGWSQVEVIDTDLGSSAALGAGPREGFQRLLAAVALGDVGIVLSREASRLSRTDKDWCHLLELCQIFDTLLADAERVYDLSLLDDQLVLGIKGTLSVVELKTLRMRLHQGHGGEGAPLGADSTLAARLHLRRARQLQGSAKPLTDEDRRRLLDLGGRFDEVWQEPGLKRGHFLELRVPSPLELRRDEPIAWIHLVVLHTRALRLVPELLELTSQRLPLLVAYARELFDGLKARLDTQRGECPDQLLCKAPIHRAASEAEAVATPRIEVTDAQVARRGAPLPQYRTWSLRPQRRQRRSPANKP